MLLFLFLLIFANNKTNCQFYVDMNSFSQISDGSKQNPFQNLSIAFENTNQFFIPVYFILLESSLPYIFVENDNFPYNRNITIRSDKNFRNHQKIVFNDRSLILNSLGSLLFKNINFVFPNELIDDRCLICISSNFSLYLEVFIIIYIFK